MSVDGALDKATMVIYNADYMNALLIPLPYSQDPSTGNSGKARQQVVIHKSDYCTYARSLHRSLPLLPCPWASSTVCTGIPVLAD